VSIVHPRQASRIEPAHFAAPVTPAAALLICGRCMLDSSIPRARFDADGARMPLPKFKDVDLHHLLYWHFVKRTKIINILPAYIYEKYFETY
jgi:hypothetical protein